MSHKYGTQEKFVMWQKTVEVSLQGWCQMKFKNGNIFGTTEVYNYKTSCSIVYPIVLAMNIHITMCQGQGLAIFLESVTH